MVTLWSFEHFDVISMVDKSTDHGMDLPFYIRNIDSYPIIAPALFYAHFRWRFAENRARDPVADQDLQIRGGGPVIQTLR